MRCISCNVDLNETAARCPLCGGGAQNASPLIQGVAFQDYPAYKNRTHIRGNRGGHVFARDSMSFREELRARFHL